MSAPAAISVAFFDQERGLPGNLRPGLSLLFERDSARALSETVEITVHEEGHRARIEGQLDLRFSPVAAGVELGGAVTRICEVEGTVGATVIGGLGTVTETLRPPGWAELDALRGVSALFGPDLAVLASARRPRGAHGHGEELVAAALLTGGEVLAVEDARISTVYDGEGRQRSAGLELWLPGEDFPRRASGTVTAGTSLELEGLIVHAAAFEWRMDGRVGAGGYDLAVRDDPPSAA